VDMDSASHGLKHPAALSTIMYSNGTGHKSPTSHVSEQLEKLLGALRLNLIST